MIQDLLSSDESGTTSDSERGKPPDDDQNINKVFTQSESLRMAQKLDSRVSELGLFVDVYEMKHRIEAVADENDISLSEAGRLVERWFLETQGASVSDIPQHTREMMDWTGENEFETQVEGRWIPSEIETEYRNEIEAAEDDLVTNTPGDESTVNDKIAQRVVEEIDTEHVENNEAIMKREGPNDDSEDSTSLFGRVWSLITNTA
jgi:hypothetical protein